jgi:LytS/YehU family sensor histidine kinase
LLQPLVENALRHGLGGCMEGGRIQIALRGDAARLRITVVDDGVGFGQNWREGTGLASVRERIESRYGDAGHLLIEKLERGAAVSIVMPATPAAAACGS